MLHKLHVDAVQAWMRVPIKLDNIDTLAVSGHKIHAPKGIGAPYLSDRLVQAFQPPYLGGEQERGLRPAYLPCRIQKDIHHGYALLNPHHLRDAWLQYQPPVCRTGEHHK